MLRLIVTSGEMATTRFSYPLSVMVAQPVACLAKHTNNTTADTRKFLMSPLKSVSGAVLTKNFAIKQYL